MTARPVLPFERPRAVTTYFACILLASLGIALPATALLTGDSVVRFPSGDRLLFEPGSLMLLELLRKFRPVLASGLSGALVLATLFAVALVVPFGALLSALARPAGTPQSAHFAAAIERLPALLWLSGLALTAQAVTLFGATLVARPFFEAGQSATAIGALALGGFICLAFGVIRDLSRAAAVAGRLDAKPALLAGTAAFASSPRHWLVAWAPAAIAQGALASFAAWLTGTIDVSEPGAWRIWLVLGLHQLTLFVLVALRTFWLGWAVFLTQRDAGSSL